MQRVTVLIALAAVAALTLASVAANPGPAQSDQLARLGVELTPVGAMNAGNADGSIPAYTGGLPKAPPIDPRIGYTDPFENEVPLYTITAANVDKYNDVLNAGLITLLKRDARTFRIRVYPTRRTAAYPEDVLAEVKKQAGLATTEGYHIRNVGHSTVPFPIPTDGLQVMWNHVFRWRGGSSERQYVWAPVAASGQFFIVRLRQVVVFDQHGYMDDRDSRPDRLFNGHSFFMSPPSALGLRAVTWEPIDPMNEPRARWLYVPQTMDTRRQPSYDYDQQDPMTNGLRTADQNDGWNGSPDRYNWKLIGKKELLIGYNAYKLADRRLRYPDIIKARNLDPELLRYEKHRVWVVEATARKYHAYYRRIFYVDEDTWQVAQEEIYDKQGRLYRFGDHHMMQFYDVPAPWYAATIHHDLRTGAYLVTYLNNMEPFPNRWGFKGRLAEFLPSNLRLLGLQ